MDLAVGEHGDFRERDGTSDRALPLFAVVSMVGGITCALFSVETAGRTLEELSPATT